MSFQIGIATYFSDLPPEDVVRLLVRTDFTVISVWGADRQDSGPMPALYKQLAGTLRDKHGLVLDSLHAPIAQSVGLYSPHESVRLRAVDRIRLAIRDARQLEIPIVIVHAHHADIPDDFSSSARRSFTELLDDLAAAGVSLALENTDGGHSFLAQLLTELPARHVGLCYDSSHDQIAPGQTFDLLRLWGHRLLTTHISDNHGQNDDHLPPGQGAIDWQAFAQAFPWNTYRGHFMLETNMTALSPTDPAEFLRQSYAGAQHILALAGQTASE